jgi:hypothetical protein
VAEDMGLRREELAWAAGFFDGEGCVSLDKYAPRIHMPQIDRRVLERFQSAVMGLGSITGPYANRNWTPRYRYTTGGLEATQAVIAMLWQWLGPVKREQASRAFRAARYHAAVRRWHRRRSLHR